MLPILPRFDIKNPTNPDLYHPIGNIPGMPVSWQSDVSGQMQDAVHAFYTGHLTSDQLDIVIAYIRHHIHAPCWLENNPEIDRESKSDIEELRRLSWLLKTSEDVSKYIAKAMDMALDPL